MRATDTAVAASMHRAPAGLSRHAAFMSLVIVTIAWFWGPLSTVINLSLRYEQYEHYSHIVIIPVISLFLIYLRRDAIFAQVDSGARLGAVHQARHRTRAGGRHRPRRATLPARRRRCRSGSGSSAS